nr:peroxidasin isoform X2 [Bactrocera oleae]
MQKALLIIFTLCCIYEKTAGKVGNNNCPIGCTCHVQTIRCSQAGLDYIPENISNDVQMIDLRYNNLRDIPAAAFRGLSFLTRLFLNYNGIKTIDKNAFVDLSNLKQLYLGNNEIKDITVDLLQPFKNVKAIYLDNNMIARIHKGTFAHLTDLSYLSLNNNELVNIPSDEFTGLPRLQYLQIDNNPLRCDCAVHSLWKKYFNGPKKTINQIILSCGSSSATYKKFATLEPEDFECNLPEIILAPENQLVIAGKSITLECDADGEPDPVIKWYFNGKPLTTDERRMLDNENTELNINNVIKNDAGIYTCIAQNYNGNVSIQANVTVYDNKQKPRLSIEPYDLEVILGTIFEIPCKATDHSDVQVIWRHDGRVITENIFSNHKYQVSGYGSLLVKNVTTADGGRYECTLKNQYGRVTASSLVKVNITNSCKKLNQLEIPEEYRYAL